MHRVQAAVVHNKNLHSQLHSNGISKLHCCWWAIITWKSHNMNWNNMMGCHCPWNLPPLLFFFVSRPLTQPHTALYPSTTAFRAHQYSYAARSEFFFNILWLMLRAAACLDRVMTPGIHLIKFLCCLSQWSHRNKKLSQWKKKKKRKRKRKGKKCTLHISHCLHAVK